MIRKSLLVVALVAVAAIVGGAIGAVLIMKTLPGNVSVLSSPGLSVLDSGCGTALTNLSFPSLAGSAGATSQLSVCLKNTGNQAFFIVKTTAADSVAFASLPSGVTADWTSTGLPVSLGPGQILMVALTLTNTGSAIPGNPSFNVTFNAFNSITG